MLESAGMAVGSVGYGSGVGYGGGVGIRSGGRENVPRRRRKMQMVVFPVGARAGARAGKARVSVSLKTARVRVVRALGQGGCARLARVDARVWPGWMRALGQGRCACFWCSRRR